MLLSESDREFYFPSVPLTGAALTGAIWRAQSTAETIAARSLDVTLYEETVTFSHSGQVQLKYVPIVTSKEFSITLLTGQVMTDYNLDADEGLLTIHNLTRPSVAILRRRGPIGFDASSPDIALKARVVYHAGFNPDDNDPRARAAKVAVASILNYQVLVN
jgi:hypothetical protein